MSRSKFLIFILFLSLLLASVPYFFQKTTKDGQTIKSTEETKASGLNENQAPTRDSKSVTKESTSSGQSQLESPRTPISHSFERFQELVSRSQTESIRCQSALIRLRESQRTGNQLEVLNRLKEIPLVPASALAAIQMVEGGDAKGWGDEQFFQTFVKLGNCSPVDRLQLLREVLKKVSDLKENDPNKRTAIEVFLTDLNENSKATTFLLTQHLQLALLSDLIDAGLLPSDLSTEVNHLKDEAERMQKSFQSELESLSRQGEHRKALELEMNYSNRIRTQLNAILEKIRL